MLKKVNQYIESNNLFSNSDKLVLALSGGIDSICLLDVLVKLGYDIVIAHCNFSLRGEESDKDQKFVLEVAEKYNIKTYTRNFNTLDYSATKKISIQMAARDQRYLYFEEVRVLSNSKYIIIGHNSNDNIETFFINLTRGTGVKGLTGIKNKKDRIVRPMLSIDRVEISDYIANNNLKYREDSSNISDSYLRNNLRHNILPMFKSINPSFSKTILNEINILNGVYDIYQIKIKEDLEKIKIETDCGFKISCSTILETNYAELYLYELFSPFGFNDVKSIYQTIIENKSGKFFVSDKYILNIDRDDIILSYKKIKKEISSILINEKDTKLEKSVKLKFSSSIVGDFNNDKNFGFFDLEKLVFPLELRKWRDGDFFYPLGMKVKKKLSDFFIDEKFSILNKKDAWILCSNNDIIWVVGSRIDDRYKISINTKKMYIANLLK
jgi:tRNA(Ile)-lysidine synthase